jgi:hypothetical protein
MPRGASLEDIPLGQIPEFEPSVAVNPRNRKNIAVAAGVRLSVSNDGGITFSAGTRPANPPGFILLGDDSLAFDSRGRLFWTFIGRATNTVNLGTFIDVFIAQVNPATGDILAGYPVNVTASAGLPATEVHPINRLVTGLRFHDKPWLAADRFIASPFRDRLYIVWTEFTLPQMESTIIHTVFSVDQGVHWQGLLSHSEASEGAQNAHVAVASEGDVYVAYHSQPGGDSSGAPDGISGQVFVLRSPDGGASYPQKTKAFGPGDADITFNLQDRGRRLRGSDSFTAGSAQPWVLPDPRFPSQVYVVAADDPTNTDHGGTNDDMDIFAVASNDRGVTWDKTTEPAPIRVSHAPTGTTQFFPTASIDDETGRITVTWYDTRNQNLSPTNNSNFLLDVFMTTGFGVPVFFSNPPRVVLAFNPRDIQLNCDPFDPDLNAPQLLGKDGPPTNPPTFRIGEYNGVALAGGNVAAVWTGNLPFVPPVSTSQNQVTFFTTIPDYAVDTHITDLDVTSQVRITVTGFRFNRATLRYAQQVNLQNISGTRINGPVLLALDTLSNNAMLCNKDGIDSQFANIPFVTVNIGSDNIFRAGESASVDLEFANPTNTRIMYSARVLEVRPIP